ncbi:MAG TPA: ATP-dependent DNA ligase [Chloroflexota bacterium]|nr:ATP-dependent DNA ligase [Chloroflexota bacterium]
MTPFAALTTTLERAAGMRGRNDRVRLLAAFLGGLESPEVRPAVNLMLGRGPGVKTGVSWATLLRAAQGAYGEQEVDFSDASGYVDAGEAVRRMAAAAGARAGTAGVGSAGSGRTVLDVQEAFQSVARAGGRKEKERLLAELLVSASPAEAAWIGRNAVGEMRTGAQEGLLLEAIATASGHPAPEVRRAMIGAGDVVTLAAAALNDGGAGLADLGLRVGAPVPPMLAGSAPTLREAYLALGGRLALEWKLDGARVQIHKDGDQVQLWSRRLTEVTARLPDVARLAREGVRARRAILEGEVIVLGPEGQPVPFQDVMRRWLRQLDTGSAAAARPASVFLFDCLLEEGEVTLDAPYRERWEALERARGALPALPRLVVEGPPEGPPADLLARMQRFYDGAVAAGHEGLMAKALDAPYAPGRRGANWLKVKAQATLDLAIIGADWGTGRRHKWLSNYHLACRDSATGAFLSVGETFKGLTDAEFAALTERLLALQTGRRGGYVSVQPRVVVEVTFNGVQRSTRLPSGVALRFARITAIRDDKAVEQVETLAQVRALLPAPGIL